MMDFRKYISLLLLTTITLCLTSLQADAQRDTTGTAARTDSIIEYLTPLEYAFMMHEKTRFMLRVPMIGLGAEVEVLPYFTLMGEFYLKPIENGNSTGFKLDAEMRWYYGSKKKGVRNMSGNYFAIGYINSFYTFNSHNNTDFKLFYGRWGIQRRLIGDGLIDIGLNAGLRTSELYHNKIKDYGIFLQSTGIIGLGIVFNKEKALDADRLCPVLKCFEKETFLLKLNMANLFSLYHSQTRVNSSIAIKPQIALEQKLFDSPFSIGVDFLLEYAWTNGRMGSGQNEGEIYNRNFGALSSRANLRYYYNLNNRIRKGRCGDGLSANYLSGGIFREDSYNNENNQTNVFNAYMLTTGVQRTFGNHFYFDVELGGAMNYDPKEHSLSLYGNMQLGIKF